MLRPTVTLKPLSLATRLYATCGTDYVLKAQLPPLAQAHPRAAATLVEALALWFEQPVHVVLCAEDWEHSSVLGLSDGFGFGQRTLHYEVEVVEPRRRRRRLGGFADLRRLILRGDA